MQVGGFFIDGLWENCHISGREKKLFIMLKLLLSSKQLAILSRVHYFVNAVFYRYYY